MSDAWTIRVQRKHKRGFHMPNELTELTPHINQMRTKLSQTADHERSLTQALSNELHRMDQETLQNVRNITFEHEARRAGIFVELQALAASIGTFQPAREQQVPIQQQVGPRLSYHDELEASLRALLTEESNSQAAPRS